METQIDLNALADYILFEVECCELYEDDAFGIEFRGERLYCERYLTHYYVETKHGEVFELPRH